MEVIQHWLDNGADYNKGVKIYKNTKGCSKMLLRQFALRETTQRKEKLIYELKKLIPKQVSTLPTKLTALPTNVTAPGIKPKENVVLQTAEKESKRIAPLFHELPPELRPILLEANNLFKENCLLKVQLNEVAIEDEATALEIQTRISRNFKANAVCWDKIEYWQKHKQLPKETSVENISAYSMGKLLREQANINSSVSRMEKRLKINQANLSAEENPAERNKLLRKIAKQEKDILQKREQQLIIKNTIDVKSTSV
ncbi:hypothetical protein [Paenimyroides baculatum]|uniref:Uncharacterized protein n=1 Tax=Paenimyroides baculatum TaxID=2608000 RepID=A0A5M6CCT3_9FLAO|nr:hypothetical protein [Paenimyroides baculatum]KAA5532803.1 hypothetical protein F0460_13235 [Paenimyroides baculatum]